MLRGSRRVSCGELIGKRGTRSQDLEAGGGGWKNQTLSRGEPLSVSSIPATHDQAHGGDSGPVGVRRFLFRMSWEAFSGGARPLV